MKVGHKAFKLIVVVAVAIAVVITVFSPPLGKHLSLPTRTPRSIALNQRNHDPIVLTNADVCLKVIEQLKQGRRSGSVHKCPLLAEIQIESESGDLLKLQLAPGHWLNYADIFYNGVAYSLPPSVVAKVFALAESK